jgi:hypothetical protein
MKMAHFSFDTSTVPASERQDFALLPAGWYTAQIVESDVVVTKNGGERMKLTLDILSEGYRGRKVWGGLNVRNASAAAEGIAQQQLRDICAAIGLTRLTDTAELHNKPLEVRIKVVEDPTGHYEPKNEPTQYRPVSMAASGFSPAVPRASAPAAPAAPATPPSAPASPPWAKRAA